MGIKERFKSSSSSSKLVNKSKQKNEERRRSSMNLVAPDQVTEESLQVWMNLPSKIRHDPSLVSFQMEHERLHGAVSDESESDNNAEEIEMTENVEKDDFITMKAIKSTSVHDNNQDFASSSNKKEQAAARKKYCKMALLILIWIISAFALTSTREKVLKGKQVVVPRYPYNKLYTLPEKPSGHRFNLILTGGFLPDDFESDHENFDYLEIQIRRKFVLPRSESVKNLFPLWYLWISPNHEYTTRSSKRKTFELSTEDYNAIKNNKNTNIEIMFKTNSTTNFAVQINYDKSVVDVFYGSIFAMIILIFMYTLIIWEIVHRTFAAVISSILSIAILAYVDDRPTMEEIITWINIDTLLLLFSMMIFVAVLTETGVFDYLAVIALQVTAGKIWPLFYCLCIITCALSAFMDNITTVLLMTPISIRLCEVIGLNPVPFLMAIIVHSNIGGTLTPIGDPPSIVIYSDPYISKHGVTFLTFVKNMAPGVILAVIQSCLHFRFVFRDIHALRSKEPRELKELRREITVWKRTADSLSSYSKDVDLVRITLLKKVKILENKLQQMDVSEEISTDVYKHTLEELKTKYPIKNKILLMQSGFSLLFVLFLFFLQSFLKAENLSLGWITLLGVILLLIISHRDDMDSIMSRIEWTTLLFFAAMFIAMETLDRLGLINWIGKQTENIILLVSKDFRLAMAIFIIMLVSSLTSCLLENITVTAMMVKIVVPLAENTNLGLPIQPLVWAIAFGPCLGGNGTLYGSSSNVVCAGIAEQHGYQISFLNFLRIVFPMMIGSVIVTTIYLLFAHNAFHLF